MLIRIVLDLFLLYLSQKMIRSYTFCSRVYTCVHDDCQTVRQGIFLSWCVCIALFGLVNHFRSNTHIHTSGRRRRRIPGYVPWAAGANQNWFACIFSQWTNWIIRDPSAKWADQWMLVGNHWERLIYFLCAFDHARLSMAANFHMCTHLCLYSNDYWRWTPWKEICLSRFS